MVILSLQVVDYSCKSTDLLRAVRKVLHKREKLRDDTPDILDVPKINQEEFAVNCRCLIWTSS